MAGYYVLEYEVGAKSITIIRLLIERAGGWNTSDNDVEIRRCEPAEYAIKMIQSKGH